jgi:hypothetical protein
VQVDVDRFIDWLRLRGTPEAHLDAFRHYATVLAKYGDITEAVRAEQAAGAAAQRITNLRQTAAHIAEFSGGSRPLPVTQPPPVAEAPPLAIGPRKGCICKKHHDVYIDNDFGIWAKLLGGGAGVAMFFLTRTFGLIGAMAVACGLAATGGTITIGSICFRCEGCRRTVRDLDADERSGLRKARGLVTLITLGLAAGAVICAVIWYTAVKARYAADHDY